MAFSAMGGSLSHEYAVYGIVTAPGSLPAAAIATWLSFWVWNGMLGGLLFVIFLFPTGRLPSPLWRPIAWAIGAAFSAVTVVFAFGKSVDVSVPELRNPFFVESLAQLADALEASFFIFLIFFGTAIASLIYRARSGPTEERQQLKWMVSAAVFMLLMFAGANYVPDALGAVLYPLAIASLPTAIVVAILRYRLYEIDVVIERTLVYGALTAMLGAIYVGGVVLLQAVLRPLTGGSEIAVAATTLSVVALFQPLRKRIQDAVDRRFYRSRYDAERALEAFSSRLRDEVDLVSLEAELLGVVHETVRPRRASLWLRAVRR
jgi:hypothetical protein